MVNRLEVNLNQLTLKNPIIPASGTFGFGYEFNDFYDIDMLGALSIKGVTISDRFGNPTPRIIETESGLINSVGLQNPGIEKVIECEIKKLKEVYTQPIIANINGFTIDEYVKLAKAFENEEQVKILEINISCPNVHKNGVNFSDDLTAVAQIIQKVKQVSSKQIFIKLSPNVSDIVKLAKVCEDNQADGVCLVNTFIATRFDLKTGRPILVNKIGGLSGPCIFPIALRMVNQVSKAVSIPVIGIGGISSAEDVIEMMSAGASAVQIGAANLIDPYVCQKIIQNLDKVLDDLEIKELKSVIKRSHKYE